MTIRVVRNDAGNCVNFVGTTNPAYWNACLSAEVDSDDATRINVINDIRTQLEEDTIYEFYKIPYTDFEDAEGNAFSTAQDCADYITQKANVVGSTGSFVFATNDTVDFERDATNTSILVDNGDYYPVNAIKAIEVNGTITIMELVSSGTIIYSDINHQNVYINDGLVGGTITNVINELNALFTVTPLGGGTDAVTVFPVSATTSISASSAGTQDPVGTAIATDDPLTTGYGRYFSTDFIRNPGEYFLVKMTGKGRYTLGLYEDGVDTDLTALNTNAATDQLWSQAFYDYGSYQGPWTTYGRQSGLGYGPGWNGASNLRYATNTDVQNALVAGDPVLLKIGINNQGYINVWYYDEGRSNDFILISRNSYALPEGDYGLMIKFLDTNASLYELPTRAAVDPTVTYSYRYIESPDGSFHYPLFASIIEASGVDVQNGGAGDYTSNVYIDEPTNSTWYMPNSVSSVNVSAAPVDTSAVAYTEIPTEADNLYAPAAFTIADLTVDEGASVNYQISPQDVSYTTTVSGLPGGLSLLGGYAIDGTAPDVTGNTITNPSDSYTVTVTRTNNFGATTSTFVITVNNITAPATAVAGFTWNTSSAPLLDTSTMDVSSVVSLDNILNKPRRMVFPQSWVESYVLPKLTDAGDEIWLGVKDGSGVLTDGVIPADWDAYIKWEYQSTTSHNSVIGADTSSTVTVNSLTDAFYDYAFEADDNDDLYVIACNVNNINLQPGVAYGGSFARTVTTSGSGNFTIEIATPTSEMTLSDSELSEIVIPAADRWIQVNAAAHVLNFDGSSAMPTLNAGYTYRFLMADVDWADQSSNTGLHLTDDDLRFTADGSTEYTTGITRVGDPSTEFAYVEFAVPSDAPPLWWYTDHTGISQDNAVTIAGSTYVVDVSGITLEGPVANQTGTNLFDAPVSGSVEWGWLSIDEQLGAGQRLVMDNAFLIDLTDAMPNDSMVQIGLKDGTFSTNNRSNTYSNFEGGARFEIFRYSASDIRILGYVPGATTISKFVGTNGILNNSIELAIDLTNSGDNIRLMIGSSSNSSDDVTSTAYADWSSSYKIQTGDQGFGLTNVDVVILGDGQTVGNSDQADGAFDSNDVDWTGLSEISVPTPTATLTTSWTKALDFGGSSERTLQVNNSNLYTPLKMGGINNNCAAPTTAGNTSNDSNARPWATTCVFNADGHSSNQHIWNLGEGAGTTDDNIYLRIDASRNLYFGWGRSGELNECKIASTITAGSWYGVYIASTGERVGGSHTASDIADCFDIRIVNLSSGATGSNLSTSTNWTAGSFGSRMNREFTGDMTIGGRGANRSFHGKVAAMVITTLRRNVAMPTDAEISMMVRDPEQWLTDYKVGNSYRRPSVGTDSSNFQLNSYDPASSTQVWLMGDGTSDAYAKIRNQVYAAEQNRYPMNMISMVSNDIETVSINGLT